MPSMQETPWYAKSNCDFIWNSNLSYQKELNKVCHCYKIQTLLTKSKLYEISQFCLKKILVLSSMTFWPAINKGGLHYVN